MKSRIKAVLSPLTTLGILICIWVAATNLWGVPNYILPRPLDVVEVLYNGYVRGAFWKDVAFTLEATTVGYAFGCGGGIVMGALFAESKTFDRFLYPFVISLQSVPKIALAPLIIVWFGYGLLSKVVMVGLVCFFPIFINTIVGIKQASPNLINMMRAFSASEIDIFLQVKIKAAMGHIFAGLQIGVAMSLIGAVVAEFVASSRGLGYLIQVSQSNLDLATMFAALVGLASIGIVGTTFVRLVQSRLIFWDRAGTVTTGAK